MTEQTPTQTQATELLNKALYLSEGEPAQAIEALLEAANMIEARVEEQAKLDAEKKADVNAA